MTDNDVSFCQHTVTEFITKEDNYTTGTVKQFHSSSAATRTSPHSLAMPDQELPTWNATSRKLLLNLELDTMACR